MSPSLATASATVRTDFFCTNRTFLNAPARINRRGKFKLSKKGLGFNGIFASGASLISPSEAAAQPSQRLEMLPFKPEGYNFWTWKGHRVHYVVEGEGSPIVLVHGFGASAYHWRYNIPELAKKYKVYALDLLGFGWSAKALIEYDTLIWRDQLVDFWKEIVKQPAVFVGNSLGGFTTLVAAATLAEKVKGVVLLNSAGNFADASAADNEQEDTTTLQKFILNPVKEIFQRIVLGVLFWQAKQPARIESILKSVYINSSNVDDYLIDSISWPAADPNAGEVYYRLMTRIMSNQRKFTLDAILTQLSCPLLLLWGDLDPWISPMKANRIKELYLNTSLVNLQAGHCPHDEVPELVNKELLDWLSTLNL